MDNDEAAAAADAAATAAMPPQFTLFGTLSSELRLQIWHCALGDDAPLHIRVGLQWRMKLVDHWCWAGEGGALCGHRHCRYEDQARAGKAPHRRRSLEYITDGFFFAPEKPDRRWPRLELGPEYGGHHHHVGAACREARQVFLKRFLRTMVVYNYRHADLIGRNAPYRLVRFNGALDVLVARQWILPPIWRRLGRTPPPPPPPPRPTFASFRAALASFRHLAFVATEPMAFQHSGFFGARILYDIAESVERLSVGGHRAAHLWFYLLSGHTLPSFFRSHPWPPVDPDPGPDLWVQCPRPEKPTIGYYLAP